MLEKALRSALNQNFRDMEIIVVNDGSKDETPQVLDRFSGQSIPVKIITHEVSRGITFSRSAALRACSSRYVALLDDDDIWIHRDKTAQQATYLRDRPDCVLVGGGIVSVDEAGKIIRQYRPVSDQLIRTTMLFRNNFFTSSVMFRRDAATKAGGFIDDGIEAAEDYDLWLRLGLQGRMHNFHSLFTQYHRRPHASETWGRFITKQVRLAARHANDYPWAPAALALLKIRQLAGK